MILDSYNLRDAEIGLIREALAEANGNQVKAATALGVSRHALHRRMVKYNVDTVTHSGGSIAFRIRWIMRDRAPRRSADLIAMLSREGFGEQRVRVCLTYLRMKGDLAYEARSYRLVK